MIGSGVTFAGQTMNKRDEIPPCSSDDDESICDSDECDEVEVDDFSASKKPNRFTINNILGLDERDTNDFQPSTEPVKPIAISTICGACK